MPHALVTFSKHPHARMRQRGFSQELVAAILAGPDKIYLGTQGNLVAETSLGPGATVRVVFIDRIGPQGPFTHVVTVMWK